MGKDQSGHIRGIGYELYMQLVEEVAHEIKKEPYRRVRPVQIKTDIDVYIPDFYIPEALKLNFYRRLSKVGDMDGLAQIYEEMLDRFGKPPLEVENLYAIARIKILAEKIDVKTIIIRDRKLNIEFYFDTQVNLNKLSEITQRFSGRFHNTSVMFNFKKDGVNFARNVLTSVIDTC